MFTPKAARPLALGLLIGLACLSGCGRKTLDSPEYGEILQQVPRDLNRPYPLPELDPPSASPLAGPEKEAEETPENPE